MKNHSEKLDYDTVVELQKPDLDRISLTQSTFRVEKLCNEAKRILTGSCTQAGKENWLVEGVECEVLKIGSPGWQKGKVKLRVTLEFYPDEPPLDCPENSISTPSDSPLDDIRQLINEGNYSA